MKERNSDRPYVSLNSFNGRNGIELKKDLFYYTTDIVNVVMLGNPYAESWVLVDAGMPGSGKDIISIVKKRFGKDAKPKAIVLTHGHFDHVGDIKVLLEEWEVPVYAHPLEFPYLTGEKDYPRHPFSLEQGFIPFTYPTDGINIKNSLLPLPGDHSVPYLPDWIWVPSVGHSPGHISLYRTSDRVLISGDAFITVRQDALYKTRLQKAEINGPPVYLTHDWQAAWESVKNLALLKPSMVVPGHGHAMRGEMLKEGLRILAEEFDRIAIPDEERYAQRV